MKSEGVLAARVGGRISTAHSWALTMLALVAMPVMASSGAADFVLLNTVGCNATALVQVPGTIDTFMGRQLLTADGQIAGVTGPNDCSGGNPDNEKNGKVFNRWALTLDHFDWTTHQFTLVKVLLDTSIDPATKQSRAIVTGGPMKGAVIRSAYDPDVVAFRGEYWVVYECTLEDGKPFTVQGTSSCISVYDPALESIDLHRTQVIISGVQATSGAFTASAVPALLVYRDQLFIYWSALTVVDGRFSGIRIRGAELVVRDGNVSVKGADRGVVHSIDDATTTEVWTPDPADPTADTTVDLRGVWVTSHSLVAAASIGGHGCTAPSDHETGCFRLALVNSDEPLGRAIFNHGRRTNADSLPSNAQEYTRPIRAPDGAYWFIGHFIKPSINGQSDSRPMPNAEFWRHHNADSALVMFPMTDRSLWPIT